MFNLMIPAARPRIAAAVRDALWGPARAMRRSPRGSCSSIRRKPGLLPLPASGPLRSWTTRPLSNAEGAVIRRTRQSLPQRSSTTMASVLQDDRSRRHDCGFFRRASIDAAYGRRRRAGSKPHLHLGLEVKTQAHQENAAEQKASTRAQTSPAALSAGCERTWQAMPTLRARKYVPSGASPSSWKRRSSAATKMVGLRTQRRDHVRRRDPQQTSTPS